MLQYLRLNTGMPTHTAKPQTVTQTVTGDQIRWNIDGNAVNANDSQRACSTSEPLTAVHGVGQLFGTGSTAVLHWSGYADTEADVGEGGTAVTGIAIRVYSDKRNRCLDKHIKLTVNGTAVGNNLAKATAGNDHTYTAAVPAGTTLGTIHRLGVETQYKSGDRPHRDNMTVDTVHLVITY